MKIIRTRRTMDVAVERGRETIRLEAATAYVMHDREAEAGAASDAFEAVEPLPAVPARFAAGTDPGRLVVPFIGGMGDAVALLPILEHLARRWPATTIDVATTPGPAGVFALCPRVAAVRPYPLTVEAWGGYDTMLGLEAVDAAEPGFSLSATIAAALGLEGVEPVFPIEVPAPTEAAAPTEGPPLVGIAVGDGTSVRAVPAETIRGLVAGLVERGAACVLLGHPDPTWAVPAPPPMVTDLRGATPSVLELAVWLREMDVVVTHDSFIMHLAGALGLRVTALFAPTAAALSAPYPDVRTWSSGADCAPCHATGSACPRGLERCIAWDGIAPGALVDDVLERAIGGRAMSLPLAAGQAPA